MTGRLLSLALAFALAGALQAIGCSAAPDSEQTETMAPDKPRTDIAAIIAEHEDAIMQPGVTAVGESVCDGTPCIRIYIKEADEALERRLPRELAGVPVVVEVSGEFRAR